MRTSTKVIRLCAVVPAGLAGCCVAVIGLGFLPGAGVVFAFLGTLLVSLGLACGFWEAPAARILGFARGMRPGEQAVLQAPLAVTEKLRLAPRRLLVRRTDTDGAPAAPIGRRTVMVQPWLVQGLYQRRITDADAATAIGHAVATQQVGPARLDLAARLWAFPATLVFAIVRHIACMCSWPAAAFAWRLRVVLGVVAVGQGFQSGGSRVLGVATAVVVAITYLAPAADRAWRAVVERDADRMVASSGLATPLIGLIQWRNGSASLERVHRVRVAAAQPRGSNPPHASAAVARRPQAGTARSWSCPGWVSVDGRSSFHGGRDPADCRWLASPWQNRAHRDLTARRARDGQWDVADSGWGQKATRACAAFDT